ncbi:MAG: hypothetical protein OCD76_00100 [Reichenbachiella sp.]
MKDHKNILLKNLAAYKRKALLNQLIKSSILYITISLLLFLAISTVEYFFHFNSVIRGILLLIALSWLIILVLKGLTFPYLKFIRSNSQISNSQAAREVGEYLPEIQDKLLNTIQLELSTVSVDLANASVKQRSEDLSLFTFSTVIDLKKNFNYLKYSIIPLILIIGIGILAPQFFGESTQRIVNYNTIYENQLFQINLETSELVAYKNEDYTINFNVEGQAIPNHIFVNKNGVNHKINLDSQNEGSFTFEKVNQHFQFQFHYPDYKSSNYNVVVVNRPEINKLVINLFYPKYTKLGNKEIKNNGNLQVPEGTLVQWSMNTISAEQVYFKFSEDTTQYQAKKNNLVFNYSKAVKNNLKYQIELENEYSKNKTPITFDVMVIKDEYPSITVDQFQDSTLFSFISFSGQIGDDYGFKLLHMKYVINDVSHTIDIPIQGNQNNESFLFNWNLDSLNLSHKDKIEYYFAVYDNDGINGPKMSKTSKFIFAIPSQDSISHDIDKNATNAKSSLEQSLKQAQELNKQLKKLSEDSKRQKNSTWEEKKKVENLIKQKEQLQNSIKELNEEYEQLLQKKKRFEKPNPKLEEKANQLQELMDELLDDETKQLYDELQKLLQEQSPDKEMEQTVDDLQKNEENLEKNLERAIEMFKQLQFDFQLDKSINKLEELEKKQESVLNDTKEDKKSKEELLKDQKEVSEEFEELKEELEKLDSLNNDLKSPKSLDDMEPSTEDVSQELEKSEENLQDGKKSKAEQSQSNAQKGMESIKKKMQDMQASMEMTQLQENMDHLRDILHNLLILSFDQEKIMKDFQGVNQSDPRYISLSQHQLKIKDDAKIIEDSLLSLASRVFQIQSFVTREVQDMNDYMEKSLQGLKDRKKSAAVTNQQYTMTSINNLALLLSDVLKQMQAQMAEAMGMPQKGKGKKSQDLPSMSQMQKGLKEKIESLKNSGKSGRQLSKELAQLAAEQQMLRQELQNMESELEGGESSNNLKEAIKKMEQTEKDLVNKNITQQTIRRQEEILTRMLQAESAMKEREKDKKREAETAKNQSSEIPKEFEEYIKLKQAELELLNTVPPSMNQYYKEEVDKYFKRLNEQ